MRCAQQQFRDDDWLEGLKSILQDQDVKAEAIGPGWRFFAVFPGGGPGGDFTAEALDIGRRQVGYDQRRRSGAEIITAEGGVDLRDGVSGQVARFDDGGVLGFDARTVEVHSVANNFDAAREVGRVQSTRAAVVGATGIQARAISGIAYRDCIGGIVGVIKQGWRKGGVARNGDGIEETKRRRTGDFVGAGFAKGGGKDVPLEIGVGKGGSIDEIECVGADFATDGVALDGAKLDHDGPAIVDAEAAEIVEIRNKAHAGGQVGIEQVAGNESDLDNARGAVDGVGVDVGIELFEAAATEAEERVRDGNRIGEVDGANEETGIDDGMKGRECAGDVKGTGKAGAVGKAEDHGSALVVKGVVGADAPIEIGDARGIQVVR